MNLIIRKKVSVLYNTDTLCSILALYVLLNLLMPILNLLMPLFQPPDATFSIFQECQSCESEVLVRVSPNHSSSTRDLEKPILALPLHRIGPILTRCAAYQIYMINYFTLFNIGTQYKLFRNGPYRLSCLASGFYGHKK